MTKNQKRLIVENAKVWFKRRRATIIALALLATAIISTIYLANLILQRRECQAWIDNGLIREQWQADHCQALKVIQ